MKRIMISALLLTAHCSIYVMEGGPDGEPTLAECELGIIKSLDQLIEQAERLGIDCDAFRLIRQRNMPVGQEQDRLSPEEAYRKIKMAQAVLTLREVIAEKQKAKQRGKIADLLKRKSD